MANFVTGSVTQAMLIIYDKRSDVHEGYINKKNNNAFSSAKKKVNDADTSYMLNGGDAVAGNLSTNKPAKPDVNNKTLEGLGKNVKIFYVQFNPKSLIINVNIERASVKSVDIPADETDEQKTKREQKEAEERQATIKRPKVSLTFTLIFDKVVNYDAFMNEKFALGSAMQLAQGAAATVNAFKSNKKEPETVQTEIEGLIAALGNDKTRDIEFRWDAFKFRGWLSSIQGKYTMFNGSGYPIRAEVVVRLNQDATAEIFEEWNACLKKLQDEVSGLSSSLAMGDKYAGNLLNLSI